MRNGGWAFPTPTSAEPLPGMTLRDYFAAAALCGILADSEYHGSDEDRARNAYSAADAMLTERARSGWKHREAPDA